MHRLVTIDERGGGESLANVTWRYGICPGGEAVEDVSRRRIGGGTTGGF